MAIINTKKEHGVWFWAFGWLALAAALALVLWLGFERGILYWRMHAPWPKQWTAAQLTNGETVYGFLAGVNGETIALRNVYRLERFTKINAGAPFSTSSSFAVVADALKGEEQLVPAPNAKLLFINRSSVLYWRFVEENDEVLKYLK